MRCQRCPAYTHATADGARSALGWRVWSGVTLTGQRQVVVLCPQCVEGAQPDSCDVPDEVDDDGVDELGGWHRLVRTVTLREGYL